MTKELAFWLLMFACLVAGAVSGYRRRGGNPAMGWEIGMGIFLFAAVAVLGWAHFGEIIKG